MSYYRELVASLDVIKTLIENNNTLKATIAFERREQAKLKVDLADARLALSRAKDEIAFKEQARIRAAEELDEGWNVLDKHVPGSRKMRAFASLGVAIMSVLTRGR